MFQKSITTMLIVVSLLLTQDSFDLSMNRRELLSDSRRRAHYESDDNSGSFRH